MEEAGFEENLDRVGFVLLKFPHSMTPECLILRSHWCCIPDFVLLFLTSFFCLCSFTCYGCFLSLRHPWLFTDHGLHPVKVLGYCSHCSKCISPVLQKKVKACGLQMQKASLEQDYSAVQISVLLGQLNGHLYFYTEILLLVKDKMGKNPYI